MGARTDAVRTASPGASTSRSRRARRAREALASTWGLGVLVFALTWGGGLADPMAFSLDVSSHAGINMALHDGLAHGGDIVFSYGPLGFLKTYLVFYEWPARLATLYGIVLHLALCLSLVWVARRNFPLVLAVVVAIVAAALLRGDQSAAAVREDAAVVVLAFIWCVAALSPDAPPWARKIVVYGGAPFAAVELLAKLNTGLIVLALVAITVLAVEEGRRRNLEIAAAGFLAPLVVLWFATGQGLGDVGDYLSGSFELVSGYSAGARLEYFDRDYDYILAPAMIAVAAGIALISTDGIAWRRRGAIWLMLALVAFASWKAGVVSHEDFHMATTYSTILGVCLAFRLPRRPPWVRYVGWSGIAAATVAAITPAYSDYPLRNPVENVSEGAETLWAVAVPGELGDEIADSRAEMIAEYGIGPEIGEPIAGRSVHVDPSEAALAWAYDLDWRPLPLFQSYTAWTPELDERNAAELESADGPDVVLRQVLNPVGRFPAFDSPDAMIAMLCNFAPVGQSDLWQTLERTPSRCGAPRPLGEDEATYGEPLDIPDAPPGHLVFARVSGLQVDGRERVRAFLNRARSRQVAFADGHRYPFVPTTAEDSLLLRVPRGADYEPPFELAPGSDTITFYLDSQAPADPITAEFFSMPIEPLEDEGALGGKGGDGPGGSTKGAGEKRREK